MADKSNTKDTAMSDSSYQTQQDEPIPVTADSDVDHDRTSAAHNSDDQLGKYRYPYY